MSINYGWFVHLTEIALLDMPIGPFTQDGVSLKVTAKRGTFSDTRFLAKDAGSYFTVEFDSRNVDVKRGTGDITPKYNLPIDDGEPHSFEVISGINPTGGAQAFNFIVDDIDRGWEDAAAGSNDFWEIRALLANTSAGKDGKVSRATVKSDATTTVADWDGNYVLNAAGTAFITRTEANNNPSSAETGFDGKLYDVTSVSGNHITLPAGYSWEYIGNFTLPATVSAGSTANAFTAPADFVTSGVNIDGLDVPFTFASAPNGTFDAPAMGNVAGFPRFGAAVQVQLVDSAAGLTAQGNVAWEPSGTYEYRTLTSDAITTDPASICYGWTDPLVTGDQVVYDPAVITVSSSGTVTVVTTSATFSSVYYIIDNNGMQESVITQDSTGVTIPTVNITVSGLLPVNTATALTATATDAATFKWEVLSKPDGAIVTFSDDTLKDTQVTVDTAGAYQFRLTGFNSAGDGSANDAVTLNAGEQSDVSFSITGMPDGTYETYVTNADTGLNLFNGNKVWSGGSASFTLNGIAAGANCVVTVLGATDAGVKRGVSA